MGYSDDEAMVRVDFFKPSGKWYTTEAIKFFPWAQAEGSPYDAFEKSLEQHLRRGDGGGLRLEGMIAVCLEPYHEHAFPLMAVVGARGPHHVVRLLALHLDTPAVPR